MGGKSGPKIQVNEFKMSIHMAVCHAADQLLRVFIGEKLAWQGNLIEQDEVTISEPELFGGPKKEGGASGRLYFLPGDVTQVLPEELATRLGKTSDTCPAFRNICSLWFTGSGGSGGFYWTANQPYLKSVWAEVTCIEKHKNSWVWYPERAKVPRMTEDDLVG